MKTSAAAVLALLLAQQAVPPLSRTQASRTPAPPSPAAGAAVLDAERAWAGADILLPFAISQDATTRQYAVRALGRLEQPSLVRRLIVLGSSTAAIPAETLTAAIAQSLYGFDPAVDPALLDAASSYLTATAGRTEAMLLSPYAAALGHIHYGTVDQFRAAEKMLDDTIEKCKNATELNGTYHSSLLALESLRRLNPNLIALQAETVKRLTDAVENTWVNDTDDQNRAAAFSAIVSDGAVTQAIEVVALSDSSPEVRRLAVQVLGESATLLAADERVSRLQAAMDDRAAQVRYEALKAYLRAAGTAASCNPILDRLADHDSHVVLAALDALGDACAGGEDVTTRLIAEARTPEASAWNRPAHAFVALAKRSPEDAAIAMGAFATHPSPWVRKYAAAAAAAAKDQLRLEALAQDSDDNVREAAITPLARLRDDMAPRMLVADLGRRDYQLLRTTARLMRRMPPDRTFSEPLADALIRVTHEHSENSRDARLALLDALAVHGDRAAGDDIRSLVTDIDPVIAHAAAPIVTTLTGKAAVAAPNPVSHGGPQMNERLDVCVTMNLSSARTVKLKMLPAAAPITVDRFLTLALQDHYYDGLSIHRVVPNFVIQGGSPAANEYVGQKDFMRDEVGADNVRGSVGLSTRGRNTGDAQFYINLIDSPRLDQIYTVFATVVDGMDVIDQVEERDGIRSITLAASCKASGS